MFIDFSQLESINELTTQNPKPMLTTDQIEKLELCRDWIQDVSFSEECRGMPNSSNLVYAIRHIETVLKDHQPCDYIHSPQIKQQTSKSKLQSLVLDWAANTTKVSFIGIVLCGLGTVFCYGLDRVQQSRGEEYQPVWNHQAKVFEGLAICSISVAIGSGVVGVCASGGREND